MSLLTMVQGAADIIGIGRPSTVVSSASEDAKTLLALAQQEGRDLTRAAQWQLLTSEHSFTSIADSAQASSAFPADFSRFVNETIWDRTQNEQLFPISGEDWQRYRSAGYVTVVTKYFRRRGDTFLMLPTPAAGDTIAYEYVTLGFCKSSGGTVQTAWAADTDVGRLDEELMKLGLVWRYRQSKGLDYAEDLQTYEIRKAQIIAADKPRGTINMGVIQPMFPTNVPEGSWDQ